MNINTLGSVSSLHSAYIVTGLLLDTRNAIVRMLEARGVPIRANPDVYELSVSEFAVDDARAVTAFASFKPFADAKYFILSMSRATVEAQNALLKVIEDAPGSSIFFFIVENEGHLLPTIRSRSIHVSGERADIQQGTEAAAEFLTGSYETRLAVVEKMTGYISKTQDRAPSRAFVRALLGTAKENQYPHQALRDLLDADRYLRMQGGSAKAVLSHLAVALPRKGG